MKIEQILGELAYLAPLSLQESYDNAGLITGNKNWECTGILLCLDSTEAIVNEAISNNCNLIVAHHPIVFKGLKTFTGKNYVERTVINALKNDIAIYAIHTNLDNVANGVNKKICDKLNLSSTKILTPKSGHLSKLMVFGLPEDMPSIQEAIFEIGGGQIGNYSECSFVSAGTGSFKPNNLAKPAIGEKGKRAEVKENQIQLIVPNYLIAKALDAAKKASSYEELAYDIIPLSNEHQEIGSGMIGELDQALELKDFLRLLKDTFNCKVIKHTEATGKKIKRVAVCGGAGSFLLQNAIQAGADIFVSSDFKYHEFFDADKRIIIADIGHYESEQFTIELLAEQLKEKFPTFAVRLTNENTNPVIYF